MAFLLVLPSMIQMELLYSIYKSHPSIQTDTRLIREGDLFFALKGPNFNGNAFAAEALDKGAAYAIVDELPGNTKGTKLILVDDVLTSLQELAKFHRKQFSIPFCEKYSFKP